MSIDQPSTEPTTQASGTVQGSRDFGSCGFHHIFCSASSCPRKKKRENFAISSFCASLRFRFLTFLEHLECGVVLKGWCFEAVFFWGTLLKLNFEHCRAKSLTFSWLKPSLNMAKRIKNCESIRQRFSLSAFQLLHKMTAKHRSSCGPSKCVYLSVDHLFGTRSPLCQMHCSSSRFKKIPTKLHSRPPSETTPGDSPSGRRVSGCTFSQAPRTAL